ncbi:hypothetical protein HNQ51_001227 [Inhella inkyongensis]|uniref:Uncharacterized protein n=1 Tax=Inhella inkyongensis TaxID=392593 RepID=A0A840S540_9BURK|nr:hypothetical protein [Inhella inkyongensis]MBB5203934.1 hypothetical protein [Inhella inkyongensis]
MDCVDSNLPEIDEASRARTEIAKRELINQRLRRLTVPSPGSEDERAAKHAARLAELKQDQICRTSGGLVITHRVYSEESGKHEPLDGSSLLRRLEAIQSDVEGWLEDYGCTSEVISRAVRLVGVAHKTWHHRFEVAPGNYVDKMYMTIKYRFGDQLPELDGVNFAEDLLTVGSEDDADADADAAPLVLFERPAGSLDLKKEDLAFIAALEPFECWSNAPLLLVASLWFVHLSLVLRGAGDSDGAFCAAQGARDLQVMAGFYADAEGVENASEMTDLRTAQTAAVELGRRGIEKRHAKNRAVKRTAIELYQSREWKSRAEAVRAIAPQVSRDPTTVKAWFERFDRVRRLE